MEPRPFSHALGILAALSTLALAACNSLTGADQLSIVGGGDDYEGGGHVDDDETAPPSSGDAGPGPAAGSGAGPGSGAAAGGDIGQGGSHEEPIGSASSAVSSSSSSSSSSVSSSSSTGNGVTGCDYPPGSGIEVGQIVSGSLAWQGYAEGASQSGTVSIQEYHDCDGSKGINALLIINSATWCGVCQEEAQDLPSQATTFKNKGIRVITLMVENQSGSPATLATATSWKDYFGLGAFATVADPNFTFAGFGSVGLPLNILVNPRTMKIVDRTEGYGGYADVIALANQNAN